MKSEVKDSFQDLYYFKMDYVSKKNYTDQNAFSPATQTTCTEYMEIISLPHLFARLHGLLEQLLLLFLLLLQ